MIRFLALFFVLVTLSAGCGGQPGSPAQEITPEESAVVVARYSIRSRMKARPSFPPSSNLSAYSIEDKGNGTYLIAGPVTHATSGFKKTEDFVAIVNIADPESNFPIFLQVGSTVLLDLR